jgi:AcrR family transcriptional regulator
MVNKNNNSQNRITKESIFTALMTLMEKKNFNEISITEITKKAGVSRMAFYRNYNVIEDIITSYLDEFFEEYFTHISSNENRDNCESVCLYFAYFRKHQKLITNLTNSNLTNLILERCTKFFHSLCQDLVCEKSHSPEKEIYSIEFLAGGVYKVLIAWAKSGMKESDEDMGRIVYDLMKV